MSLRIGQGGGGNDGGDEEARRAAAVRSAAAKKRGARRWTNWGLTPPPSLRDYAPRGRFFGPVDSLAQATVRARRANGGEGSSAGGGRGLRGLLFATTDEEEKQAVAEATAKSEAEVADELEAEKREMAQAIALVEALKRREAEQRAAEAAKRARHGCNDYADQ